MASSPTGKWVSRAAATGGGRQYRGRTPVNWYLALVVIVVLGVFSVGFARYEYGRSPTHQPAAHPWYAGLALDRCGTDEPVLPASPSRSGVSTPGQGVLSITLADRSQATLGRFVRGYPGLTLTASTFRYPGTAVLANGAVCPKGSPDAGKKGVVQVVRWANFSQKSGTKVSGDPQALRLTNGALVTAAFVPAGAKVSKPPQSTIDAVLSSIAGSPPTTTTTAPPTTSTTTPGSTTTAPGSTTTAPGSTTTSTPAGSATTASGTSRAGSTTTSTTTSSPK